MRVCTVHAGRWASPGSSTRRARRDRWSSPTRSSRKSSRRAPASTCSSPSTRSTAPFSVRHARRLHAYCILCTRACMHLQRVNTGYQRWVDGLVQLCEDKFQNLNGSIYFGTLYSQNCTISSSRLNNWPLLFYEPCTPTCFLRLEYTFRLHVHKFVRQGSSRMTN